MIEVEKKFLLAPNEFEKLLQGARFIRQQKFTDVYYDDAGYSLTRQDWWLRSRNGIFELKVPFRRRRFLIFFKRPTDQYREIGNEGEIRTMLGLGNESSLIEAFGLKGIRPFSRIMTTRSKYMKEGFVIDIDDIDFGYQIVEIELNVENSREVGNAERQIVDFASHHGLRQKHVRGKVTEYLFRNSPEHYRALKRAGVV